jgi:hypothetical protein
MEAASSAIHPEGGDRRHHAVIAGTGRAGTTFLVQFLAACGLETSGEDEPAYFPRARAGLEHSLLSTEALPYIVKDSWLFAYCNAVDLDAIAIDALIIPMRDLMDAATSRVLQERIGIVDTGWRHRPLSHVQGATPGGVLFSLDAMDQARLLAVGFYELLFWAVTSGIPLFLLEFPRLIEDDTYLVRTLWPWLSTLCDEDRAYVAFQRIADLGRVRVASGNRLAGSSVLPGSRSHADLDRAAMVALLDEQSAELTTTQAELTTTQAELTTTQAELTTTQAELTTTQAARDF